MAAVDVGIDADRLLARDVLAGGRGRLDDLAVQGVRRGDVDDIDVVAGDQLAPVEMARLEPEIVAGEVEPLRGRCRRWQPAGAGSRSPGSRPGCRGRRGCAPGPSIRTRPRRSRSSSSRAHSCLRRRCVVLPDLGIDQVFRPPPLDDGHRLLERDPEDARLAVRGRRRDMRSDDDVVSAQQRVARGERLRRRDVQPRPEQVAVSSAPRSASWSTSPPRAVLMNTAPRLIAANWAAPNRPRDSSVNGT